MTQREIAVVLVVDIIDSTSLRQAIGEGPYSEIFDALRTVSRRLVVNHTGSVVKELGDGLMAVFPTATGALSAGVGILQANATMNRRRQGSARISLRLGASAGEVCRVDDDLAGMAPVDATRLEAAAEPDTLYCADLVRVLAEEDDRFAFEAVGPLELAGRKNPVTAFRVAWTPWRTGRALGIPDTLVGQPRLTFVGRSAEVERLSAAWSDVRRGKGRLVAIGGEPGVGKTRLCAEVARQIVEDGGIVLYGRADQMVAHPYQPFVEALTTYVRKTPQLESLPQATVTELARLVPEIAARFPDLPKPARGDSDTERYFLFEAVVRWLDLLAQEDPVALIIDDATWASPPTLDMLCHIAGALSSTPILLVVTYRPQGASDALRGLITEFRRRVALDSLQLHGLEEMDVIDALSELLGDRSLHPAITALASVVWRRSGGNPFFVGELFADLLESGSILVDEHGWHATMSAADAVIPDAVGDVVRQRVRSLSPTARRLVEVASICGIGFDIETVGHVVAADPADFVDAIDEAEGAGLLHPGGDGNRYVFAHALVRDIVYEEQSPYRRGLTHSAVGHAIEHVHKPAVNDYADELALHYSLTSTAEEAGRAIWYAAVAARRSTERLAHAEAAVHYRRALGCLGRAALSDEDAVRAGLLVDLGVALHKTSDPASGPTLVDAARLAVRLGDGALCARAILAGSRGIFSSTGTVVQERVELLRRAIRLVGADDTALRAMLLAELSVELSFAGDHTEQDALSDEATSIARRLGDEGPLIRVLTSRLATLWRANRMGERLELAEELDSRCLKFGRAQASLLAATMGCQAVMEAGDFATADRRLELIDAIAEDLRHPLTLGYARLRQAMRAAVDGRLDESERLADEAYELCLSSGQPDALAFWVGQRFNIRFHQGRLDEIIDELADAADRYPGIVAFRAAVAMVAAQLSRPDLGRESLDVIFGPAGIGVPDDLNWLTTIAFATQAASELDDRVLVSTLVSQLVPYREQFVDNASTFFGSVEHYIARGLSCLGRHDEAAAAFERAVEAHRRLCAPILLALTHMEWAEAELRAGAPPDAPDVLTHLTAALETAEQLDLRAIAGRARRALSVIGKPT